MRVKGAKESDVAERPDFNSEECCDRTPNATLFGDISQNEFEEWVVRGASFRAFCCIVARILRTCRFP